MPPHEEPIRPRTCEAEKIVTNILKKLLTSYLFLNIKYLCFHVNTNKTVALYLLNRSFKLIFYFLNHLAILGTNPSWSGYDGDL